MKRLGEVSKEYLACGFSNVLILSATHRVYSEVLIIDMYAQVREEEQVISPQFTRSQQDVSMRRRKKRKQVEDGTSIV